MSNFEDEKLLAHSKIYHATVRKLREENAEKEKRKAEWEAAQGPKPTLDFVMGGPLKSEEEISKIATQTAERRLKDQENMERIGVAEPTSEKPKRGSLVTTRRPSRRPAKNKSAASRKAVRRSWNASERARAAIGSHDHAPRLQIAP